MNKEAEWREKKHKNDRPKAASTSFLSLLLSMVFLRPVWSEEEERRRKRVRWIFVRFSAWHYAGCDKIWAGLVIRLFKALQKDFGEIPLSVYRSSQHPYPKKIQRGGKETRWKCRQFLFVPLWLAVLLAFAISIGASVVLVKSGLQMKRESALTWTTLMESVAIGALGLPAMVGLRFFLLTLKNLFYNQGRNILKKMNSTTVSDQMGFMNKVRKEVAVLADFIHFMEIFEKRKVRVVLEITNLDRCRPDRIIQTLEAINILLSGENVPFVSILAIDPSVVVKSLENSIFFARSHSNSYDFLNEIVTLPFNVPEMCIESKCSAFKVLANSHLEVCTVEEECDESSDLESRKSVQLSVLVDSENTVPFLSKNKWDEESMEKALTWEVWAKRVKTMTKEALEFTYNHNKPLHTYLFGNSVHMRRIINSVRVTIIVMDAAYGGVVVASDVATWVVLANNWPCRLSWILQCVEDWQQRADMHGSVSAPAPTKPLWEVFVESRQELRELQGSIECILEQDGDPELFQRFLQVDFRLTVREVLKFKPSTVNLDPSIKKTLARLRENRRRNLAAKKTHVRLQRAQFADMTTDDICNEMERLNLPEKCQQLLTASGLDGAAMAYGNEEEIRQALQMTSEEWNILYRRLTGLKTIGY
ncbi:NTPase KAP family P-loop domain-containing protein 1-like isoform X2 [Sardina pilchardus]